MTDRDGRVPPHSIEAEEALLGAMLLSSPARRAAIVQVDASDFYRPALGTLFAHLAEMHRAGEAIDATTVAERLRRAGQLDAIGGAVAIVTLVANTPATSSAAHYARIIAEHALRRSVIAAAGEIAEVGYNLTLDAGDSLDRARAVLSEVEHVADNVPPRSVSGDAFAHAGDEANDWIIPGFVDREDRAVFVAPEGFGKSVWLRQAAIAASQGVCPFTFRNRKPIRAHIFDLENPGRIARAGIDRILDITRSSPGYDPDRLMVFHEPGGLDIRTRQGFMELERELAASRPDLVCIGPLYKLFGKRPGESDEDVAADVTRRLDDLRTRFGFALWMEHHAPHGAGIREMRPFGSTIWLRWPEFGPALSPASPRDRTVLEWGHWRGPRDVRPWPNRITRGQRWPWAPVWDDGIPSEKALDMESELG